MKTSACYWTKWCKVLGVRRWELSGSLLVVIGCLFFPWAGEWVWITITKCFRVVSQSVVSLLLLMKIHIIVVSMFLQFLSGAWERICHLLQFPLSSPALPFIWFWDKRGLNPPCFFCPSSMACVTIFWPLKQAFKLLHRVFSIRNGESGSGRERSYCGHSPAESWGVIWWSILVRRRRLKQKSFVSIWNLSLSLHSEIEQNKITVSAVHLLSGIDWCYDLVG